ncbi:unnamed protein product [Closterium sp. NIES-65]|nr:unnamed protein product [Closterium sp. NIES-65]
MTDRCGRPQANILLVNDSGAVFEQAVDCNMESKSGGYIASLLRPVIDKRLVEKRGEMITFVRNHHFTRAYMKKVGGKQVLKPAGTRFGTQYIAMARLCEVRSGLAAMVLSNEWKVWAAADKDRKTAAEKFRAAVMDEEWWDNSLACPMHVVGRILNPANQEERIFRNDVECTRVFKDYIERHYDNKTFKRGKDAAPRRASLVLQEALLAYINMEGSFGKPGAISAREAVKKGEMSMVQWWSWHSTEYPELAALACPVLTQPVSASPCERGWAQWEGVHTTRHNRLGTVVSGNIPDVPIPPGYNMDEEEDDMLGEEGEDAVLADEYGEGVVVERPRKEIGCGEAS